MVKAVDRRAAAILSRLPSTGPVVGAELGIFHGKLSMRLLKRPDLFLHMIDTWASAEARTKSYAESGDAVAKLGKFEMSLAKHDAFSNTHFAENRRKIHQDLTALAAKKFEDGSLDFVFIDADHSYEGVRGDIELWLPKVKSGGLLCGHDYDSPTFPGVALAVKKMLPGRSIDLGEDRTWFARIE